VTAERAAAAAVRIHDGGMAESSFFPTDILAVRIDDLPGFEVTPGITGRLLPATDLIRAWAYDFAPGTRWPVTDHHSLEERYYVASGEIDDNGTTYPAGTYVVFAPGTSHRPGSRTGGRMIGLSDARDPGEPVIT